MIGSNEGTVSRAPAREHCQAENGSQDSRVISFRANENGQVTAKIVFPSPFTDEAARIVFRGDTWHSAADSRRTSGVCQSSRQRIPRLVISWCSRSVDRRCAFFSGSHSGSEHRRKLNRSRKTQSNKKRHLHKCRQVEEGDHHHRSVRESG